MIRASIYGRLGGDPIERQTRSGKPMVTASLAVDVGRNVADDDTEWFGPVGFGNVAETLGRHRKGDLLSAMGQLAQRHYTDRDSQEREVWSLVTEAILFTFTTRRRGGRKRGSKSEVGQAQAKTTPAPSDAPYNDDIPF